MKSYFELIDQTFYFPNQEFKVEDNQLFFNNVPLNEIIEEYGTPLKITYLPKISQNIQLAKNLFNDAINKFKYSGSYTYCYCTKSSHFQFVMQEALKNDIHIETSSAYDIPIVRKLHQTGKVDKNVNCIRRAKLTKMYLLSVMDLRDLYTWKISSTC